MKDPKNLEVGNTGVCVMKAMTMPSEEIGSIKEVLSTLRYQLIHFGDSWRAPGDTSKCILPISPDHFQFPFH